VRGAAALVDSPRQRTSSCLRGRRRPAARPVRRPAPQPPPAFSHQQRVRSTRRPRSAAASRYRPTAVAGPTGPVQDASAAAICSASSSVQRAVIATWTLGHLGTGRGGFGSLRHRRLPSASGPGLPCVGDGPAPAARRRARGDGDAIDAHHAHVRPTPPALTPARGSRDAAAGDHDEDALHPARIRSAYVCRIVGGRPRNQVGRAPRRGGPP
jgi:hypothetical protein